MQQIELYATAAFGVESVVARELKFLGYPDTHTENGKIHFQADLSAIARTNLWLRSADRVFLKIGAFDAYTFDQLFEGTKALPWENWLTGDAEFPVNGNCVKSTLMSISDCQSIVKKAVVERMKRSYKLDRFPENGPRYKIEFSILNDHVILAIDTSGSGLHKRGYRTLSHVAPIKETLAAALIQISRWHPDRAFVDPFCGSGTIPIEAALIARNQAPGLDREFDAQEWPQVTKEIWYKAYEEAKDSIKPQGGLSICGYDNDQRAIDEAQHHAKLAGVADQVHIQKRDVRELASRHEYGFIICNPPYGQRIGEQQENERMAKAIGKTFATLTTWSWAVITADQYFERAIGKAADKKRKLFNGGIPCQYYQYFGPKPLYTKKKEET